MPYLKQKFCSLIEIKYYDVFGNAVTSSSISKNKTLAIAHSFFFRQYCRNLILWMPTTGIKFGVANMPN